VSLPYLWDFQCWDDFLELNSLSLIVLSNVQLLVPDFRALEIA
jgi:hypothetical protein